MQSTAFKFLILYFAIVSDLTCQATDEGLCQEEGRTSHLTDCTKYVDCVSQNGKLVQRIGECHNSAFDPQTKKCASFKKTNCEKRGRQARALFEDGAYSFMCPEGKNGFFCADCKTLINCVDGRAYSQVCSNGDMCAMKDNFYGGVCYPNEPAECTCQEPNVFKKDLYNKRKFFYCNDTKYDPVFYECDEGSVFDAEESQCKSPSGLPQCQLSGIFPDFSNCTQYYICISTRNGWVQKAFSCNSSGLMYNEVTGACEDPCTWQAGSFACSEEGRFSDPKDCQRYIECIPREEGGFRQISRRCPDDYSWDPTAMGGNGHCVMANRNSQCKSTSANRCTIPDGLCAVPMTPVVTMPESSSPSTAVEPTEPNIPPSTAAAEIITTTAGEPVRRRFFSKRKP